MALAHCIYCSLASNLEFSAAELQFLLHACRAKNARLDVSGMLLYADGAFFQVLEGERDAVESLFETIAADRRHYRVTKIVLEPIAERAFSDWTMGYSGLTYKELQEIPGLNDFFAERTSYMEIGEGRAKLLLNAFKEGQWRASLGPRGAVVRRHA